MIIIYMYIDMTILFSMGFLSFNREPVLNILFLGGQFKLLRVYSVGQRDVEIIRAYLYRVCTSKIFFKSS